MSLPRPVVAGASFMLTRRVLGRAFRLRPCPRTNAIVRYVVAVLAAHYGVAIHAMCAMSNHWHVVATGPGDSVARRISGRLDGRGPVVVDGVAVDCLADDESDPCADVGAFIRDVHAMIARHIGASFGEFEGLWNKDQVNKVDLPTADDILGAMVYTVCNPVKAGLVKHGHAWPGARAFWPQCPRTVHRPPGFFRDEDDGGSWPTSAVLTMTRPPGFDGLSDDELGDRIHRAIADYEQAQWAEAARAGRGYLGRRAVLAQSRTATPSTPAPRFRRKPRVNTRDPELRRAWWKAFKMWQAAYRRAYDAFRRFGSATPIPFPAGTFKLRIELRVPCSHPS